MRQPAIPKLSKLSTAGRAELLASWTVTLGKPPRFRASRELLASALAWQLQERKFGGLKPATKRKLRVLARPSASAARSQFFRGLYVCLSLSALVQPRPGSRVADQLIAGLLAASVELNTGRVKVAVHGRKSKISPLVPGILPASRSLRPVDSRPRRSS